jgi:hypothetical protein
MNKAMFRLAALAALVPLAVACAPTVGNHGFQVVDVSPKDIVAGTDTKSTVLAQLGSPSAVSSPPRSSPHPSPTGPPFRPPLANGSYSASSASSPAARGFSSGT